MQHLHKEKFCANTGKQDGAYCVSTMNATFWEKWEHWEMPRTFKISTKLTITYHFLGGIPYFLKRCAVTRELFDLVIEMRPSMTAKGLSEHIKREHNQ